MLDLAPPSADPESEDGTGLPGARTWRAVYLVVLWVFALWVVLLTILPHLFT